MSLQMDDAADLPAAAGRHRGNRRADRRSDIQGLRAIAVLLVVAFHAGLPLSGGFIGVDMFFVISGCVITGMLLRQLERTNKLGFSSFYSRRMRRLLPALALLVVVVAVGSAFLLSPFGPQQGTAKTGLAASLFTANLQLSQAPAGGYFGLAAESNAFLHTWSLSVEEQFYLAFPALLVVAWRLSARFTSRRSRRRSTAAFVLVATAASFALSWYTTYHSSGSLGGTFAFYSPATRAWEFGAGALLALSTSVLSRLDRRLAGVLGVAGVVLVGVGAVTITDSTPFPGVAALLPVFGTALILIAGMATSRGITSVLGVRPLVWVGDVSYGWYLWHWPLIVFAAAMWPGNTSILVATAIGSLIPTWLSYHFIENPIRFNVRLTGRRIVPLAVVCIGAPVAACLGLLLAHRLEMSTQSVKDFSAATKVLGGSKSGCDGSVSIGERSFADCTWSVAQPRGTVFLVGDSNAGHFVSSVARAANQEGYDLTVDTGAGCPFVDLIVQRGLAGGSDGGRCHQFVTAFVTSMKKRPPALVVLAASSSQHVNNSGTKLVDPRTGETASTPAARARLWEKGLASVLDQLAEAGIPTLVVHPVPHFGETMSDWQPLACPMIRIADHSCGGSIDRAKVESQQRPARDAEDRAVATVPLATAVDFTDDVCSARSCSTFRNGRWLYRDATHLSITGALTLTDRFRQLIVDHARG